MRKDFPSCFVHPTKYNQYFFVASSICMPSDTFFSGQQGMQEELWRFLQQALSVISYGNHPQVIQVQKFVTILGRYLWYYGRG